MTAAVLAVPAFYIGVQADGVRAGVVQVLMVLIATAAFGRAAWRGTLPRPFNASLGALLLALLAGVTAISIGWSLLPNASLLDAVRLIAYTSAFSTAALAAQLWPGRSREVVLGIGAAALLIAVYAVLSHTFPSWFSSNDDFARLRLPFGYWNAVGTVAVIGLVCALWAGSHRAAPRWLEIVSYPAGGIFGVTLMLSQSRGALFVVAVVGLLWLLLVPLRIRTAGWSLTVGLFAGIVVAWAYSRNGLTTDGLALAQRKSAGLGLGLAMLLLIAALTGAGFAINRLRHTRPLSPARRYATGRALLALLVIVPILGAIGVSVKSDKGASAIPDGIKDAFSQSAPIPGNDPSRLTATSSLRGRYWHDAFKVFDAHTLHGTGGDTYSVSRLPYRHDTIIVQHAHGMVPQVAADLGVIGLLILLALTIVWLTGACKLASASKRAPYRWLDVDDEQRLASVTIMLAALAFGLHSAIDWVWFVPGVAFFGLLAGGWTLGLPQAHSAPREAAAEAPSARLRGVRAGAIAVAGVIIAFAVYQPVHAERKVSAGLNVVDDHPAKGLKLANQAIDIDPTSADAYFLKAVALSNGGHPRAAEATLVQIAIQQPSNPETWQRLAQFRLTVLDDPAGTIAALRPLLYQSPNDVLGNALLAQARQQRVNQLVRAAAEHQRKLLEKQLNEIEKLQKQAATGTVTTG